MAIYFENDEFIVKQALFGMWKVRDKRRGLMISPDLYFQEVLGFTWPKVRRGLRHTKELRRATEDVMFLHFARASADPMGPEADMMRKHSPTDLAVYFEVAGREALSLIRAYMEHFAFGNEQFSLMLYQDETFILEELSSMNWRAIDKAAGFSQPVSIPLKAAAIEGMKAIENLAMEAKFDVEKAKGLLYQRVCIGTCRSPGVEAFLIENPSSAVAAISLGEAGKLN